MKNKEKILEEKIELSEEKKEVLGVFENAKKLLADAYGVENLSNIEAFRLRKLVEQCLKQNKQEIELEDKGRMNSVYGIEPYIEAPARWLWESYGIHDDDIPWEIILTDEDTGKRYKYSGSIKKQRDIGKEMRKKLDKLEKEGHDCDWESGIPDSFKEYIRRLREKAHNP